MHPGALGGGGLLDQAAQNVRELNNSRRHTSLGDLSPAEFEALHTATEIAA